MITLDLSILNQKGTPMFFSDLTANRPAAGIVGRIFIATDSPYGIFRDTGSAWDQVAGSGGGGNTIYTANDTLTSNRVVSSGGFDLSFTSTTYIGTAAIGGGGSGKLIVGSSSADNGIQIFGANAPSLRIDNAQSGGTQRLVIGLSTAINNFIQGSTSGDICISSASASPILFGMWQTINATEVMRISTSNNLLLGKITDSGEKLQVSASLLAAKFTTTNSGIVLREVNGASTYFGIYGSNVVSPGLSNYALITNITGTETQIAGINNSYLGTSTNNGINVASYAIRFFSDVVYTGDNSKDFGNSSAGFNRARNIYAGTSVIIGSTVNSGQNLQVTGTSIYNFSVSSAALGYSIQTSGTNVIRIYGEGSIQIGGGLFEAPFMFTTADTTGSLNNTGKFLKFFAYSGATPTGSINGSFAFGSPDSSTITTNNFNHIIGLKTFAPTSGTATFNLLALNPTINQTGGANGISRGIYLNPTITAASDYRSIEYTNNTGYGIYASGTANNYFSGNVLIGSSTNNGQKLQVTGSIRVDGQTSGTSGGSSGLHLIINCDGTNYKIALNNI